MKHVRKTIVPGLLLLVCMLATGNAHAQQLPDTWQKDMVLTTWYGAGMRQQSDSLRIAADSSFERHSGLDNHRRYRFHFTEKELNDLLAFLKLKHFDKIRNGPPAVICDGWSSDITLQWNNNIISINTGAAYEVLPPYQQDLAAIIAYINKLTEQKKKHR
ncbi:MAG TPA: hypothetical protein VL307_19830 [Chitinophagaceae bacterium]|nr:hypothetical protein [Chitinophagaceae bacterium]